MCTSEVQCTHYSTVYAFYFSNPVRSTLEINETAHFIHIKFTFFSNIYFLRSFCTKQILLVVLGIGLAVTALYDVIFTLRTGGDPTLSVVDMSAAAATTFNNPGFREGRSGNGK